MEAVKSIEKAVERRCQGKSDVSDKEPESEESDDEPLASKTKNGCSSPLDSSILPPLKKRKKMVKKSLPSREEVTAVSKETNLTSGNTRLSPDTTADADSATNIVTRDINQ